MSKYDPLWRHIAATQASTLKMTFEEIRRILGFPLDHSFLTFKKELASYGYSIDKISLKNQTVDITKTLP